MIPRILEEAERLGAQGDVVLKFDRTTSLRFRDGRLQQAHEAEETGANLRLVVDGRIGSAGSTTGDPDALVEAALASARLGQQGPLFYPEAAPSGDPLIYSPEAESADLDTLGRCGSQLSESLIDDDTQVEIALERSVGSVHVANTRGVDVRYEVSSVTLDVTATAVATTGSTSVHAWWGRSGLPSNEELEGLVSWVSERLKWAVGEGPVKAGAMPVCFTHRAMATLLTPVRHALGGKAVLYGTSPLADRIDQPVFDSSITLIDDPWEDGRPGSRPIDDEGVVCRPLPLVEDGFLKAAIYDLETAVLAGVPSTGHGRRSTFGKPQPAYSNLRLLPGDQTWEDLLRLVGDGLVVDGFHDAGRGFARSGAFKQPASLAFRVSGGEIAGKADAVTVSGNIIHLLSQVSGLGRECRWMGSMCLPPMVLDGVRVQPR